MIALLFKERLQHWPDFHLSALLSVVINFWFLFASGSAGLWQSSPSSCRAVEGDDGSPRESGDSVASAESYINLLPGLMQLVLKTAVGGYFSTGPAPLLSERQCLWTRSHTAVNARCYSVNRGLVYRCWRSKRRGIFYGRNKSTIFYIRSLFSSLHCFFFVRSVFASGTTPQFLSYKI